jgi:hypothetical protein
MMNPVSPPLCRLWRQLRVAKFSKAWVFGGGKQPHIVLSVFHPLREITVRLNVNVRFLCAVIAEFTSLILSRGGKYRDGRVTVYRVRSTALLKQTKGIYILNNASIVSAFESEGDDTHVGPNQFELVCHEVLGRV